VVEQLVGLDHLVPLPRRDRDVDRSTFGIDHGVKLGRETASRTAEGIALDPPFSARRILVCANDGAINDRADLVDL
jgi:hypothetical protein